jgi:hypothetical protein
MNYKRLGRFICLVVFSSFIFLGFVGCPIVDPIVENEVCPAFKISLKIVNTTDKAIDIDFKYVCFSETDYYAYLNPDYPEQNNQSVGIPGSLGSEEEVTWDIPVEIEYMSFLSFQLMIDGERYAGWLEEDAPQALNNDADTVRYGLGYMTFETDFQGFPWFPYLSTLTPKEITVSPVPLFAHESVVHVTYQVTVSDEGAEFEFKSMEEASYKW